MTFVHVKLNEFFKAQRSKDANPADSQDDFLAQSMTIVAAIELLSQHSIGRCVFLQVGVEQENGNDMSATPFNVKTPSTNDNLATSDRNLNSIG